MCKKIQQKEHVILVDKHDKECGFQEKIAAHKQAQCHRAFSVFIYRIHEERLETLLQQRQLNKYHCGGLWTNTCCGHPRPGENTQAAAERRLGEEMGIHTPLIPAGSFHYIAHFENGLTENEVDHVFIGEYPGTFCINPTEVSDYCWTSIALLKQKVSEKPAKFTPWLQQALNIACKRLDSLI